MSTHNYLLSQFESKKTCKKQRELVVEAVRKLGEKTKIFNSFSSVCDSDERCLSGLCPVCCRLVRKKLLRFVDQQEWHKREWLFITVFVDGWTMKAGDFSPFGSLRDHKSIKNLKQHIRRLNKPNTLLFGSIETVFKTIANEPYGKPFHLHLMISGVDKATITACIRKAINVDKQVAVPIKVQKVKSTSLDFHKTASYAFKLPFWKKSYLQLDSSSSRKQFPKQSELSELISNLGMHTPSDRLIMMGMRFHGRRFKLTSK